ncbi:ABC transporter permease [Staphylococcus pettenkoferi]|uniref:ABC transporter permease n=1 Tax=Staphylococcus pettenkoferi TaxID=170573 RepID=UPI002272B84B|nr:ABC transporter permease [Staphylococcus pettenkoferi]MCY1608828.1 ABC transporter permease [Staphylococcus pettenkoferi]
MITLVKYEFQKLKKNHILPFLIVFSLLGILLGSSLFLANRSLFENESNESLVLWSQTTLYSSQLFFPILIGILCSISWQLEEVGENWLRIKILPVKVSKFILAKFISILSVVGLNQIFFIILFTVTSIILQTPDIKFLNFLLWSFLGWIGSASIISIQLFISIKLKGFTFPILLSAVLSIIGLMTLFVSQFIFDFFPFAQMTVGMRSRIVSNMNSNELFLFIFKNLLYTLIFLFLSNISLKRKEG